jgi:hypothetical protein
MVQQNTQLHFLFPGICSRVNVYRSMRYLSRTASLYIGVIFVILVTVEFCTTWRSSSYSQPSLLSACWLWKSVDRHLYASRVLESSSKPECRWYQRCTCIFPLFAMLADNSRVNGRRCVASLRFDDSTFLPVMYEFHPTSCGGRELASFIVPVGSPNGNAFITWLVPSLPLFMSEH